MYFKSIYKFEKLGSRLKVENFQACFFFFVNVCTLLRATARTAQQEHQCFHIGISVNKYFFLKNRLRSKIISRQGLATFGTKSISVFSRLS